jgi:hypothetical protein
MLRAQRHRTLRGPAQLGAAQKGLFAVLEPSPPMPQAVARRHGRPVQGLAVLGPVTGGALQLPLGSSVPLLDGTLQQRLHVVCQRRQCEGWQRRARMAQPLD